MDHFKHIYTHEATAYHSMIDVEDVDGNLLPALERGTPLQGKRVLDLGSGTGRLPLLFAAQTAQMIALDLHWDMLREHSRQRERAGGRWGLVQGDMRFLPLPAAWADVVTAGWSIGHLRNWFRDDWQVQIGRVLREIERVLVPGGAIIIIETLTTGSLTPAPPGEHLAEYYAWLEDEWGFTRQTIQTDYQFTDLDDAVARIEFFFGPELAATIRANNWVRVPEWTGVWGKRVE